MADWAAWYDSRAKSYVRQSPGLDTDNLPVEACINNDDNENDDEIPGVSNEANSKTKKRNKPSMIRS